MNTPIHCSPETLDQFILLPGNLTICIKVLIMKIYFDPEIPLSKLNPNKITFSTKIHQHIVPYNMKKTEITCMFHSRRLVT